MPKPNKSSASAGTRKKHAKKATHLDPDAPGPSTQPKQRQRGEKKLSKAQKRSEPKIKQYIPPPKPPAPPILDPLDGQGLARTLDPELVVVLRRLGKKDDVTRRKGLEELRDWVGGVKSLEDEIEQEIKFAELVTAVPVWVSLSRVLIAGGVSAFTVQLLTSADAQSCEPTSVPLSSFYRHSRPTPSCCRLPTSGMR